MTRFCVLFPRFRPVAYHKDVGEIPRHMATAVGWESTLVHANVSAEPADAHVLEPWVHVHDLGFIPGRLERFDRLSAWLRREGGRFDHLLLYQLTWESVAYAAAFKAANPRGVCGLKLDMDERSAQMLTTDRSLQGVLNDALFAGSEIDFFTIETQTLQSQVQRFFDRIGKPLHFVPNGLTVPRSVPLGNRRRVVSHIARLGTSQKNTEGLLEAFARATRHRDEPWQLELIGSVEPGFERALEALPANVKYLGPIHDRDALFAQLGSASIFALSSNWESFGLVLAEAAWAGCHIVSTDVGAARDITVDGSLGEIVPVNDPSALAAAIGRAMDLHDDRTRAKALHNHVIRHYTWPQICRNLARVFEGYAQWHR